QSLAAVSNCPAALSVALLAVVMAPASPDVALSDASGSGVATAAAPQTPACGSHELELHEPEPDSEPGCATAPRTPIEIAEARAYLVETASPGYTMMLQGAELAIGRLHPEFAVRLENAIREARSAGLPSAGVFSAYRPPAFGVGGFFDKFNSLHTYGLAVDMRGIGGPGRRKGNRLAENSPPPGGGFPPRAHKPPPKKKRPPPPAEETFAGKTTRRPGVSPR